MMLHQKMDKKRLKQERTKENPRAENETEETELGGPFYYLNVFSHNILHANWRGLCIDLPLTKTY